MAGATEIEISIADAIVSARLTGIGSARGAADQSVGPISNELWSKMRERWEWHWAQPTVKLQECVDRHFK